MQDLSNNQKMIVGGLSIIIIGVIGYYFFFKDSKVDYSEVDEEYQNNNISREILVKEEQEKEIIIHITGEVVNQGIVKVPEGSRISDAIETSGGLLETADLSEVNLAFILSDGQKIHIPSVDEEKTGVYITTENGSGVILDTNIESGSNGVTGMVNINTATQTLLETLPGIGPSTALKIIEYRKENGKFSSIEDLKSVSGIGDTKFNGIKSKICI